MVTVSYSGWPRGSGLSSNPLEPEKGLCPGRGHCQQSYKAEVPGGGNEEGRGSCRRQLCLFVGDVGQDRKSIFCQLFHFLTFGLFCLPLGLLLCPAFPEPAGSLVHRALVSHMCQSPAALCFPFSPTSPSRAHSPAGSGLVSAPHGTAAGRTCPDVLLPSSLDASIPETCLVPQSWAGRASGGDPAVLLEHPVMLLCLDASLPSLIS